MHQVKYRGFVLLAALVPLLIVLGPGCKDKPTEPPTSEPTSLVVWLGDAQMGIVNERLDNDFVVRVTDASGGPVSGVTVNFAVLSGGGTARPTRIETDKLGTAATTLTPGPVPGLNEVCAFASGLDSVVFTARTYNQIVINTAVKEFDHIGLTWLHEAGDGFEAYDVYRSTVANFPDPFFTVTPDHSFEDPLTNEFADYSVTQDTSYYYKVVARYAGGDRVVSNVVSITAGFRLDFEGGVRDLLMDSARNLLYVITYSPGGVSVVSPGSFQVTRYKDVGELVTAADLSADGSNIYVSTRYQNVLTYNTETWALLNEGNISAFTTKYSSSVYANPDGRVFFAGGGEYYYPNYVIMMLPMSEYQLSKVNTNFGLVYSPATLALNNPDDALYLLESTYRLYKLDLTQPNVPFTWIKPTDQDVTAPFLISPDGSALIFSDGIFLDPETATTVNELPVLGRPVMSYDKTRLYYVRPGMVTAVDAQTYSIIDSAEVNVSSIQGAVMSPSDTLMYIVGDQILRVVDVRPFISK